MAPRKAAAGSKARKEAGLPAIAETRKLFDEEFARTFHGYGPKQMKVSQFLEECHALRRPPGAVLDGINAAVAKRIKDALQQQGVKFD